MKENCILARSGIITISKSLIKNWSRGLLISRFSFWFWVCFVIFFTCSDKGLQGSPDSYEELSLLGSEELSLLPPDLYPDADVVIATEGTNNALLCPPLLSFLLPGQLLADAVIISKCIINMR